MKSDLDRLLAERNLDVFIVMGDSAGNSVMNYLTGGAHMKRAMVVKRKAGPLTLIHGSMERELAAQTGMALVDRDQVYNGFELLQKHQGDRLAAAIDYMGCVIHDQKLYGRLGIYGQYDAGAALVLLQRLQNEIEGVELIGEYGDSLFSLARETKDDREIAELVEAGRLTGIVVGEVQEFIQAGRVRGDTVYRNDGEPLTIGDVKAFMRARYMEYGLIEDHGTIFSQGRDAGIPHNSGDPVQPLRLGQPIVFDIFPRMPSGYFHDLTRTWCLGYAPDAVQEAWDQTKEIFDRVMASLKLGTPLRDYQLMTCEYYESKGHPTPLHQPGSHTGYVHSLGHGIGLDIHEGPSLSHSAGNDTVLHRGHAFSVEPGLYYPEQGFGVRIEDSVAYNQAGEQVRLTNYPYDLVIAMK